MYQLLYLVVYVAWVYMSIELAKGVHEKLGHLVALYFIVTVILGLIKRIASEKVEKESNDER